MSDTFSPCLDRLEREITWEPQRDLSAVERIYKFGEAILAVKEREWLGEALDGDLVDRLDKFRQKLLEPVEDKHGFDHDGAVPMRIKRLKNKIRARIFEEDVSPEALAEHEKDLDRLFAARQLYSYPGQYLHERPTQDRIAETILKLEQDILGRTTVRGPRKVTVTFAEPMNMADHLDAYKKDARQTIADVTERLEGTIANLLRPKD